MAFAGRRQQITTGEQTGRRRWQWGSIAAIGGGVALIVAVQALEGGAVRPLLQLPAALIVLGGTGLATLVSYSPSTIRQAYVAACRAFRDDDENFDALCAQLVTLSVHAHRGGPAAVDLQL